MKKTVFDLIAIVALFVFVPLAAADTVLGLFEPVEHYVQRWDQEINNTSRFTVLSAFGGAAVLDRETGLVWEQSPSQGAKSSPLSTFTWENAQFHCNNLYTGGRLGWRLPTLQELATLVDQSQSPTLPVGNPFSNVQQSSSYWSATTNVTTSLAWDVSFYTGVVNFGGKGASLFVWCVRGGQGVDPQ